MTPDQIKQLKEASDHILNQFEPFMKYMSLNRPQMKQLYDDLVMVQGILDASSRVAKYAGATAIIFENLSKDFPEGISQILEQFTKYKKYFYGINMEEQEN